MLTWGISGRDNNRRAAVFCMMCREVLAKDLQVNEASFALMRLEPIHKCKPKAP